MAKQRVEDGRLVRRKEPPFVHLPYENLANAEARHVTDHGTLADIGMVDAQVMENIQELREAFRATNVRLATLQQRFDALAAVLARRGITVDEAMAKQREWEERGGQEAVARRHEMVIPPEIETTDQFTFFNHEGKPQ